MKLVKDTDDKNLDTKKVSDKEAEEAIRTILSWMGEDPKREGLLDTTPPSIYQHPSSASYEGKYIGAALDAQQALMTLIPGVLYEL